MILNDKLCKWLDAYEERFHKPVPLMQISNGVSNWHLIHSIKKCLKHNVDYLPSIYGYGKHDKDTLC
jgi:hypothetical protein